jgi:hypothetical protein
MSLKKRKLESVLTLKQRMAALLCVERELAVEEEQRKSYDDIAAEIGITDRTLYNWRTQNKDFIDYVNILSDEIFEAKRPVVYKQLLKLIEGTQPSVKAMDLYLRRHGLLTDKTVVENTNGDSGKSNDDIEKEIAELDGLLETDEKNE